MKCLWKREGCSPYTEHNVDYNSDVNKNPKVAMITQGRAYTSPVWYTP